MTDTQTTREKMVSAAAGVSGSLQDAAHQVKPTFERLADQLSDNISDMAHHSRDTAIETRKLLAQKTHQATSTAEHCIQRAPFKSVFIAVGVGAAAGVGALVAAAMGDELDSCCSREEDTCSEPSCAIRGSRSCWPTSRWATACRRRWRA